MLIPVPSIILRGLPERSALRLTFRGSQNEPRTQAPTEPSFLPAPLIEVARHSTKRVPVPTLRNQDRPRTRDTWSRANYTRDCG